MTTITLTAGSEEELVKAAKARAAVTEALKHLVAALRDCLLAGNITIDLTPPCNSCTTPHDISIAMDGTITATLRPDVNAYLTVQVATDNGTAYLNDIVCELDEARKPVYLWQGQSHQSPDQVAALIKGEIDRILALTARCSGRGASPRRWPVLSGPPAEAR